MMRKFSLFTSKLDNSIPQKNSMHEKLKILKLVILLEIHTRFNETGNDKMERLFIFYLSPQEVHNLETIPEAS